MNRSSLNVPWIDLASIMLEGKAWTGLMRNNRVTAKMNPDETTGIRCYGAARMMSSHALPASINHRGNYAAMSTNVDTKLQLWLDERPAAMFLSLFAFLPIQARRLWFFLSRKFWANTIK